MDSDIRHYDKNRGHKKKPGAGWINRNSCEVM